MSSSSPLRNSTEANDSSTSSSMKSSSPSKFFDANPNHKSWTVMPPINQATKSGWLEKLGKYSAVGKRGRMAAVIKSKLSKQWKRRFFLLTDRRLIYGKKAAAATGSAAESIKGVIIDLSLYHSVSQDLDSFPGRFCLRILSLGTAKTVCLAAESLQELREWLDAIKKALPDQTEAGKKATEWLEKQQQSHNDNLSTSPSRKNSDTSTNSGIKPSESFSNAATRLSPLRLLHARRNSKASSKAPGIASSIASLHTVDETSDDDEGEERPFVTADFIPVASVTTAPPLTPQTAGIRRRNSGNESATLVNGGAPITNATNITQVERPPESHLIKTIGWSLLVIIVVAIILLFVYGEMILTTLIKNN